MTHLEKLHLEAVENSMFKAPYSPILQVNTELAASKSAEITEQIAIEFWSWMRENDTPENAEKYGNFTDKDMFQEFLKSKENDKS